MRSEMAAPVAVGVLAGVLVAVGILAVPGDSASLPASPTVTVTATATEYRVTTHVRPARPAPTVTVTASAVVPSTTRASRSRTASQAAPRAFTAWLASPVGQRISWRESRNRCDITNPTGKYQGKWQMDDAFWRTYGGLRFAPNPHEATCHEQDLVAYRGWQSRGWQPWGE